MPERRKLHRIWRDTRDRLWHVTFELDTASGQIVGVSLSSATGERIDTHAWRGFPLATLIDRVQREETIHANRTIARLEREGSTAPERLDAVREWFEPIERMRGRKAGRPAPQRVTRELLEQVARVYLENVGTLSPTRAVADQLAGGRRSTANKWVARAREVGLISGDKPKGRPSNKVRRKKT